MPLKIIQNDITKVKADAIVNAANSQLKIGGGVCGAIFSAAGAEELHKACDKIGFCNVGEAVITGGYLLKAKYIIHTVGPIWKGGGYNEENFLKGCYLSSLNLALKYKCKSIAFPLISSGVFNYPKESVLNIATKIISDFLTTNDIKVYLVVYDKEAFVLSKELTYEVKKYIEDTYVEENFRISEALNIRNELIGNFEILEKNYHHFDYERDLEDILENLDESFSQMLLRLIDEKDISDTVAYKRANVDRRLFSKIRSDTNYKPSKNTAIAFSIALGLNLDTTLDLLGKAGYTLSHSNKFDVIIEYFINAGKYDIYEINEVLFLFEQNTLGA